MNLSISNIAWSAKYDSEMYMFLHQQGFTGLEIAPTRIFPNNPYDHTTEAKDFSLQLKREYGICISSMQSIWYGITESLFGTEENRQKLIDYTKKAINFSEIIGCKNIVFGSPKNRNIPSLDKLPVGIDFFSKLGRYALQHNTVIAIEPNPPIYNTNFINTTKEAFDFCKQINSKGFLVNVDLGTIIQNQEDLREVRENIHLVNHIHISEPYLAQIEERDLHKQIKELDYHNFISIEMKNFNEIALVKNTMRYIREILL